MKKLISCLLIMAMLVPGMTVAAQEVVVPPDNVVDVGGTSYSMNDLAYEISDANGNVKEQGDVEDLVNPNKNSRLIIIDKDDSGTYISLNNGEILSVYPKGSKGFFILADKRVNVIFEFEGTYISGQRDFIMYFNQVTDSGEINLGMDINEKVWGGNILFQTKEIGYYKINIINASSETMVIQLLDIRF